MKPRIRFDPRTEMWVCAVRVAGVRLVRPWGASIADTDPASYVGQTPAMAYRGWKLCRDMGLRWEDIGRAGKAIASRDFPPMMNREHA